MFVGYARVSTTDQDLSIQLTALERAGCEKVFSEKYTGTTSSREQLQSMLEFIREGDTLVVTRIDRLARSMKDLQDILFDLRERGIELTATEQPIDTSSAAGKAFLNMLGVFAEFECNLLKERQLEGIQRAKERGVYAGRKRKVSPSEIAALAKQGMGPSAIAKQLGCSRMTVHRALA